MNFRYQPALRWPGALCLASSLAWGPVATAGTTVDFDFDPDLYPGRTGGARAFVPDAVANGDRVPLVVFLHGVNQDGRLHRWMHRPGRDLRAVLEDLVDHGAIVPAVLAAPSQTRAAHTGKTLWNDFDLAAFVAGTARAVGDRVRIDPERVVLVGYSGASCNATGGLLRAASGRHGEPPLLGLVAIDGCMNAEVGSALGAAPPATRVEVLWQSQIWEREVVGFRQAFEAGRRGAGVRDLLREFSHLAGNPHQTVLPLALREALRTLLPPASE